MSDLRTLIEAARTDAPSTAARANVWTGVSTVVGEAAASGGAGAAVGSAGAAKMLILGSLLGASVTVGVGVAALLIGRRAEPRPTMSVAAPAPAEATELSSPSMPALSPSPARTRASTPDPRPNPSRVVAAPGPAQVAGFEAGRRPAQARALLIAPVSAAAAVPGEASEASEASEGDTLAREASSLAKARASLARRDALSALQIVRGLRALPGRQLVPEELAVEAQALRGLGLDDDANAVEAHLRVRFPDSVLGR